MAQKSQDNGSNLEGNAFVIVGAVVLMLIIAWLLFGRQFSAAMAVIRKYELMLFAPFFDGAARLVGKLRELNGSGLIFKETVAMLSKTGDYVRWLYIPPIVVMAGVLYSKSFRGRFRRTHSIQSLVKQEAKLWPEIAPVSGKQDELVSGNILEGPYAVSATEWEFVEKYKLAGKDKVLNRDKAREVFAAQLGPQWTGQKNLPKHARALFAIFAIRIAAPKKKAGNELATAHLRTLAQSFAKGGVAGMDTSWVDAAIAEYGQHDLLKTTLNRHAYVFTVMATMLQVARKDGILPSSMFLWLKTVDRRLWYVLNGVGRYAHFVECSGVMSHWLFEKTLGMACPMPMVESAINGLAGAMKEYTEDDSLVRIFD